MPSNRCLSVGLHIVPDATPNVDYKIPKCAYIDIKYNLQIHFHVWRTFHDDIYLHLFPSFISTALVLFCSIFLSLTEEGSLKSPPPTAFIQRPPENTSMLQGWMGIAVPPDYAGTALGSPQWPKSPQLSPLDTKQQSLLRVPPNLWHPSVNKCPYKYWDDTPTPNLCSSKSNKKGFSISSH